ncbi:MAG: hypothetical protein JOY78_00495 [Pseudonocardia sp.]|nr:hypothetical protein [Pseudonocardia sp.]
MTAQHEEEQRRGGGGFREAVNELFGRNERGEGRDTSQLDALDREDAERRGDSGAPAGDTAVQEPGARYGDEAAAVPGQRDALGADDATQTAPGVRYETGEPAASPSAAGGATSAAQSATGAHGDPLVDDVEGRQAGRYDQTAGDPSMDAGRPVTQEQHLDAPRTPRGGEVRGDTVAPEHVQQGGDPMVQGQVQHGGEVRGDVAGTRSDADLAAGTSARDAGVDAGAAAGATAAHADRPSNDTGDGERAALVTRDRADSYSARWDSVKGEFVDEPRSAVRNADALVGELLDELQELFKQQRTQIEEGLDRDETSTEDLRVALRRYRSFFDRLLSI